MSEELSFTCRHCQHQFVKGEIYRDVGFIQCPECLKIFVSNYWNYFRREWLEILSKALIILIIFKANLFDHYVIPTSSMEPTLHSANHYPEDGGDQVLVNKFYYKLFDPKNWEVVVFNPPHKNQLFIKRLIGLPGQKIQIINGDIYINQKIARKPASVEEELLYTLYDSTLSKGPLSHFSEFKNKDAWMPMNGQWEVGSNLLKIDGGRGKIIFNYPIDDRISSHKVTDVQVEGQFTHKGKDADVQSLLVNGGYDGDFNLVGDIAIDFEFQLKNIEGRFYCEIRENDHLYQCQIDDNGRELKLIMDGKVIKSLAVNLTMGHWYHLLFKNVDDRILISVDDKEVVHQFKSNDYGLKTNKSGLNFNSEGASLMIRNIRIRRDIFYICEDSQHASYGKGQITFDLKEDQYFFLGDNVSQSSDSREWGFVKRKEIKGKALFVLWPIRIWPGDKLPPRAPFLSHRTRTEKIK